MTRSQRSTLSSSACFPPAPRFAATAPARKYFSTTKKVRIANLKAAGHYALQIEFDDGHNTGIYSWAYLAELHRDRDQLWQDYLDKLNAAGLSRDRKNPWLNS